MKIAVLGAGPAGASAAYALGLKGHDVFVFERQNVVGGRTRCVRKGDFTLDTGAGFITNFYPRLLSLAHDLGFNSEITEMNRVSGLVREGTLASINVGSPVSFMSFPFASIGDKLKMAAWMAGLTLKRKRYDLANPSTLIQVDDRSVAEHARDALNENIYNTLIRPGIEPFWYFSCEEVSEGLLLALSAHAAGAKFYVFPEGIDTICKHLLDSEAEEMPDSISVRCGADIRRIERCVAGYRVLYIADQTESAIDVDQVIVATPASAANAITADLPTDDVSDFQRSFLNTQRYASNIHACFEIAKLSKRPKVSAIFPCGPGLHRLAAVSFHHAKSTRTSGETELVSVYLSDSASKEMMGLAEADVYAQCWSLAREAYGELPLSYGPFHLERRQEAIPIHAVGRYRLAAQFNAEQRGKSIRFCGDYLATATIEGAIASGWEAALMDDGIE